MQARPGAVAAQLRRRMSSAARRPTGDVSSLRRFASRCCLREAASLPPREHLALPACCGLSGCSHGFLFSATRNSKADVPQALLLLVPRHPERFQAVADLIGRRGLRFERRSSGNPVRADCQVLLVDTVGELTKLYAAVDVAFVGGSLVPIGGHNLLEPAAVGLPVLTGPYQSNAREIARQLLLEGGALQVDDAQQLAQALKELFADAERRIRVGASGRRVIEVNRGSVARLMEWLEPLVGDLPRRE